MELMVVQVVVVLAFGVPHSCPKCEGVNGAPGIRGEWATRLKLLSGTISPI